MEPLRPTCLPKRSRHFPPQNGVQATDLYMTVVSRWGPRRRTFYAAAPRFAEVVRRVDAEPRLGSLWATRFPFAEGWEG